jgi:hypothetical protein
MLVGRATGLKYCSYTLHKLFNVLTDIKIIIIALIHSRIQVLNFITAFINVDFFHVSPLVGSLGTSFCHCCKGRLAGIVNQ